MSSVHVNTNTLAKNILQLDELDMTFSEIDSDDQPPFWWLVEKKDQVLVRRKKKLGLVMEVLVFFPWHARKWLTLFLNFPKVGRRCPSKRKKVGVCVWLTTDEDEDLLVES